MATEFLSLSDVIEIHADQIERYGGDPSVRDMSLLQSAVAMPMAAFGGEYLHADVHEMAAAYMFHIVQNHPFVDGNKRAGAVAAIVFLELNGSELDCAEQELEELAIAVAKGERQKPKIAAFLRSFSIPS